MLAQADNNLTFFLGSNQFWSAPTGGISQCGFRDGDNLYFELGGGGGVRQLGGVTVTAPGFVAAAASGAEEYRAWQRMANATAATRHTRASDGRALHTESYVHAERNLLVTRLRVEDKKRRGGASGAGSETAETLRVVLWTVGSGIGPAHSYPNKQIRIPPNISDPSLIPACAFPTRAGCITANASRPTRFVDGAAACGDGEALLGGGVSRMAGFPFQHTRRTNVTVLAAALRAFVLPRASGARLLDVVQEFGSSGGDRLSFSVSLAPGEELVLLTSLVSNRDVAWADPMQAAADRAAALSAASLPALDAQHAAWWASFWAKSSIYIETGRPAFDSGVHRFYYGALHVLASASRTGKTAPGLCKCSRSPCVFASSRNPQRR